MYLYISPFLHTMHFNSEKCCFTNVMEKALTIEPELLIPISIMINMH